MKATDNHGIGQQSFTLIFEEEHFCNLPKHITLIEHLPIEFVGTGEVKGFIFKQINSNDKAYIYEVNVDGVIHYEVIERIVVAKCLDFELKIFSKSEFKETYPKANAFGISAWTFKDITNAINKFNNL